MLEKLRIELTGEEREHWWADAAIIFSVDAEKNVKIAAEWKSTSEIYGDGCEIVIPLRVWRLATPWIVERIR